MSRRNDTPVPEFRHAQKAPAQAAPEILNAPRQTEPAPSGTPPADAPSAPIPEPPKGSYFPSKAELDEAMAAYKRSPGRCPICNGKIGRGVAGHLSKCLRSSKFKTASTTTS